MASGKRQERTLLLPSRQDWEVWKQTGETAWSLASTAVPLREVGDGILPAEVALGLPTRMVLAVPVWVNSLDPEVMRSAVALQLERMGLETGEERPAARISLGRVCQEENRQLVLVRLLQEEDTVAELPLLPSQIELGMAWRELPPNEVIVWEELGQLCLGLTRGGELAYFQILSTHYLDAGFVGEVRSVILQATLAGWVKELRGLQLWMEVPPDLVQELRRRLEMPVEQGEPPAPKTQLRSSTLVPSVVAQARTKRSQRRKIKAAVMAAAAVYLVLLGLLFTRWLLVQSELRDLSERVEALGPEVASLLETRSLVTEVYPVFDQEEAPLELLLRLYQTRPSTAIRFLDGQLENGSITLSGEANSFALASSFDRRLQESDLFWAWDWNNPTPSIDPRTNAAKFQISGRSPLAARMP
ncbi:MAG: hypothetical protein AAF555_10970 [Verrucomicrobiota bacterium]